MISPLLVGFLACAYVAIELQRDARHSGDDQSWFCQWDRGDLRRLRKRSYGRRLGARNIAWRRWWVSRLSDLRRNWARDFAIVDRWWLQWTTGHLGGAVLVRHPRIQEDAAIGLVLSTFFGLGIVLLSVVQTSVSTQTAGLDSYIYGQASAMTRVDVLALAGISLLVGLISVVLRNPFGEVCFDADFAATTGWPVDRIDLFMMGLVAVVCVVGIPAVGLMLVVAFLIVPCAAARCGQSVSLMFW